MTADGDIVDLGSFVECALAHIRAGHASFTLTRGDEVVTVTLTDAPPVEPPPVSVPWSIP